MATYLILNTIFLAAAGLAAWCFRSGLRNIQLWPLLIAAGVLLLMTLVFDNLIILADIVAYDPARISGWYLGRAPIEDFAYTLVAVLLIPVIWRAAKR